MYCRCQNCETLFPVWESLANTLNKTEDAAVAVAKVDCSVEKDLCTGMDQLYVIHEILHFSRD